MMTQTESHEIYKAMLKAACEQVLWQREIDARVAQFKAAADHAAYKAVLKSATEQILFQREMEIRSAQFKNQAKTRR